MALRLDAQGKILADGQAVDIGGLKNLLVKAREDGTIRLEVVVEVDRQCLFEHVAAVQAVCKEARGRKRAGPGVDDIAGLMSHPCMIACVDVLGTSSARSPVHGPSPERK